MNGIASKPLTGLNILRMLPSSSRRAQDSFYSVMAWLLSQIAGASFPAISGKVNTAIDQFEAECKLRCELAQVGKRNNVTQSRSCIGYFGNHPPVLLQSTMS